MTIGRLAGVPLQGAFDSSGALFLLRQAPKAGKSVEIDGWTTTLTQGEQFVVVFGGLERTIDEVRLRRCRRRTQAWTTSRRKASQTCSYWTPTNTQSFGR